GIVLTGMIFYDSENDKIEFGQSTDRILEAVRLYYTGHIEKIFISGGSGLLLDQTHKESQLLKDYLTSINVPEEDIIIETESRNTHENAVEAAKVLRPTESSDTYLLITSASHFRRAAKCFENEGFSFDSYPVDYCSRKLGSNPETWLIPAPSAFSTWNMLIHEIAGYVMYDWSGYF
ncbi:MAG: YdcF family protein, partial [Bacteroidales bacterium]|nr:YdcF family protein [Bacteroidales bacterium]